jgi:putative hydrolase of the HAD superfamily
MMKYKAVIFDLFGTLVNKFPVDESINVLREMAEVLNVPEDDFVRLWFATFSERHSGCFPDLDADIEYAAQRLGAQPDSQQIRTAARINLDYVSTHIIPRQGAVFLLEYLRRNEYKIGLVSNWSDEVSSVWQDIPISRYFDVSIFSCKAGMMKPDPRIYTMAMDQLSVRADECLYIGDGDSSEITGAEEVGMDALLVGDNKKDDLKGRTIVSLEEVIGFLT